MKLPLSFFSLKILSLLFLVTACKENRIEKYNLDFESINSRNNFSKDWFQLAEYPVSIDREAISGKYAGAITSTKKGNYGRLGYVLPPVYEGDTLKLEGYIKTKNVSKGSAGLFISIKGTRGKDSDLALQYVSTENEDVKGTLDWKKYKLSCPLSKAADYILIGGFLGGKGKALFDNFKVSIDGKDIQNLKENGRKIYKAHLDKEFDVGSKINLDKLTENESHNLFILGKIWGFLKYYHPVVGRGEINWDYELFRVVPNFLKVKNSSQLNKTILQWIKKYKIKDICEACKKTSSESLQKPDLKWIEENNFNSEIIHLLHDIYNNRHQGKHFYITKAPNVGNAIFTHENAYYTIPKSDDGFRLLSLFRYWNAIEYFFPYKYLIGKEWDEVLKEYVQFFAQAKNESEYELALTKLITEIHDTHAVLYGKREKERFHAPIEVKFIENQLVVTSYVDSEKGAKSGFKIGDIITEINNVPIDRIVDSLSGITPASNKASLLRDIAKGILKSELNELNISYVSNTKPSEKVLPLFTSEAIKNRPPARFKDKSYKFLNDNIGYITLASIKKEDIENIKREFSNAKGLIIDMRNYPNTFVPFLLGSFFVSKPTAFVKFSRVNQNNYGEFTFGSPSKKILPSSNIFNEKLVILVNEESQSQSEYTAMAFRAGINTTIVGSSTIGADGNVSYLNLPSGFSTRISGIGVYYPDGRETQRVGIIPDIEVEPTINGIKQGKDELLEKAIEYINK